MLSPRWVITSTSGHTSRFDLGPSRFAANPSRDLVHTADEEELDHLEAYLTQQLPALGDKKPEQPL